MEKRVQKFLNKKYEKVEKDLMDWPFPIENCVDQRRFSYSLGQHDLIVELRADLGLENKAE